ncbi:MFS transporter [Sporichthya polymorpha]|uniref:MFS transporter n=1 Tax=Sporichthya polymorpha TaxID=35751 RepID=UPI00037D9E89|nr:MFS transporter [Sporichthya polymorpha]
MQQRVVNRWLTLAVLCLAVFCVMVATMIVNILLPTLNRDLQASTKDLLWIVDAFNLVFAALVLAAGSLSDRFGRKGALMTGLVIYIAASTLSAFAPNPEMLILWRAVAGVGAAVVFPTTLSIISNVFPDRVERAKAIGIWGAATGASVAVGPIIGGAMVEASEWGAAFLFCAGVGVLTLGLAIPFVPTSRDPEVPRLDYVGLVLSTAALGTLVYAIIQAPERGWGSPASLGDFGAAACLLFAFGLWEAHVPQPMLDVRLFRNLRFTAASGAVTLSFFALFGFVFLITQFSQFVLGWGVLEAGLRQTPVAIAVAGGSLLGVPLAVRVGTKVVVCSGLVFLVAGFYWVSTCDSTTTYPTIAGQMMTIGLGMGLTSAPATEAIMGVVPAAKAGIGSAVNDATRELGGTLGVAVIGSVSLSVYREALADEITNPALLEPARDSVGAALAVAAQTGDGGIALAAQQSFTDAMEFGCWVAACVCVAGLFLALRYLPNHPVLPGTDAAADGPDAAEAIPAVPTGVPAGTAGLAVAVAGDVGILHCADCGSPIPAAAPAPVAAVAR